MKRALLVAALVLAGCGGGGTPKLSGTPLNGTPAPNFALTDQHGNTVTMREQRGHWSVVTFLYTQCPDVCPLIAAQLNAAVKTETGKRAGLRALAVSVDPKRDTPAAISRYAVQHRLAAPFHFLIGSARELERVWSSYHVAARPGPKGTVTHSTFEILVDPEGKERALYDATITSDQLTGDLDKLL